LNVIYRIGSPAPLAGTDTAPLTCAWIYGHLHSAYLRQSFNWQQAVRAARQQLEANSVGNREGLDSQLPGKAYRTLCKRTVGRIVVNGRDAAFRDRDIPGFGAKKILFSGTLQ